MSLSKFDYISPKITLFYYGTKRHSSNLGGILTALMVLLSASYVFYLIYNILRHKITNFMFYMTYLVDAGQFYFNDTSGIFHYFQLYDIKNKEYGEYKSKYIRIFMSRLYRTYIDKQLTLSEYEHWVYDICRDNRENKNIDKKIIDNISFKNGACLRYYYNNIDHIYYPIEDVENFKFPYLIHGSSNKDNLFLETIIEKCDNSSIISQVLGNCGNQKDIDEYFEKYQGINFQLLSRRVDTDNYESPIYQYMHSISESLDINPVPVNNINLMPYFIEINNGVIYPHINKNITCSFEFNRRENWEIKNNTKILAIFDYWLQNSAQVIKGGYRTIYDILPSIGGIIQLIYYIFYSINYLYNKYTIIQDSNKSFFRMYNLEDSKVISQNKTFAKYVNSLRDNIKVNNTNNKKIAPVKEKRDSIFVAKYHKQKQSLKSVRIYNSSQFLNINNNFQNDLSNSNNELIANLQKTNLANIKNKISSNKQLISLQKKDFKLKNEKTSSFAINNKNVHSQNFNEKINKFISDKNQSFKVEPLNVKMTSKLINFWEFILYIIKYKRRNHIFYILNQFRQKVLGEEHIFKTNVILYHLEKYFNINEIKRIDIMELYDNL